MFCLIILTSAVFCSAVGSEYYLTEQPKDSTDSSHIRISGGNINNRLTSEALPAGDQDESSGIWDEQEHERIEGYLEKRDSDKLWHRYWCVFHEPCVCFYMTATDEVPVEVIDLRGYNITQLIDHFQGKRFVLSLKYQDNTEVLLSLDSREELTDWHQTMRRTVENMAATPREDISLTSGAGTAPAYTHAHTSPEHPRSEGDKPTTQTVKEKLLAEVLRQKVELEKMQATRNGAKGETHHDNSPRNSLTSSQGHDEDRVCMLTRLIQRRMSTQIKLTALQRQMETSYTSPREKKTVFQLGKKKPDLVQSSLELPGNKTEMEEHVKMLSSKLHELDTVIMEHGATSPRDLRASSSSTTMSKNRLSQTPDAPLVTDGVTSESALSKNNGADDEEIANSKDKEKDKDANKHSGLKSSVQKLAHRTFAKANWNWNKKQPSSGSEKDNVKTSSTANNNGSCLSDMTPDVIDMTKNNNHLGNSTDTFDGADIPAPPDKFRTEYKLLPSALQTHQAKHRSPKDRILMKTATSNSFTHLNMYSSRLKTSLSSPSLVKLTADQENGPDVCDPVPKVRGSVEDDKPLSGSLSARSSRPSSQLVSPRRQVTPSAMAEIEAFEELSMKFLGSPTSSK